MMFSMMSPLAFLNSLMLLPIAAPTSGSFPGPITINAIIRIKIRCVGDSAPMRFLLALPCQPPRSATFPLLRIAVLSRSAAYSAVMSRCGSESSS